MSCNRKGRPTGTIRKCIGLDDADELPIQLSQTRHIPVRIPTSRSLTFSPSLSPWSPSPPSDVAGIHTWRNRILGANGSDPAIINLEDPPESTSSSPSLSSFSDESSEGSVLPPLSFLREVLEHIGVRVVECSSETMGRLIGKMVSDAVGKM